MKAKAGQGTTLNLQAVIYFVFLEFGLHGKVRVPKGNSLGKKPDANFPNVSDQVCFEFELQGM